MSDSRDDRIGLAVFGFGRIGRIHVCNLLAVRGVRILYIVEEQIEQVEQFIDESHLKSDHGTVALKPDATENVCADQRIRGILICTPTTHHQQLIAVACRHKKHIFCEKPIAVTTEDTIACYRLAEESGITLFCGLNRRFDPAFLKLRNQVKNGQLGHLQLISTSCRDHPEPPESFLGKSSGGIFVDAAIHNLDLISWIADEFPDQVAAMGHARKELYKRHNDLDTFGIMLKFPSGLVAYIDCSRVTPYGYDQRVDIVGTDGAIVAENHRDDNVTLRTEKGDLLTPIQHSFAERYRASYTAEMYHFVDIITGKAECSVLSEQVVKAMKVAWAARDAHAKGIIADIQY